MSAVRGCISPSRDIIWLSNSRKADRSALSCHRVLFQLSTHTLSILFKIGFHASSFHLHSSQFLQTFRPSSYPENHHLLDVMGNTQSDNREAKIYNGPINRVPVVKQLYSLVRASVYAMKGDKAEAKWSAKGAVPGWQTCERKIPAMAEREVKKLKGYAVGEVKKQWDDAKPRIINYAIFGAVSIVGFFFWYAQHNVRRSLFLPVCVASGFILTAVLNRMLNNENSRRDSSRRW